MAARANGGERQPVFELRADLPFEAISPSAARRLANGLLMQHGLNDLYDDVALVTSELVTNAVRHGAVPVQLHILVEQRGILVEVTDGGQPFEVRALRRASDESGRGLQIVARLTPDWGVRPTAAGKTVWARLSA